MKFQRWWKLFFPRFSHIIILRAYLYQILIMFEIFFLPMRKRISRNEISTLVKIILSTIFAYNYFTGISLSNFDNTWRIENFFLSIRERISRNYSFYDFRNIYYKFKIGGWAKLNIHANNYKFYKREVY